MTNIPQDTSREETKPKVGNINVPKEPFPAPPPKAKEEPTGDGRKTKTLSPDK